MGSVAVTCMGSVAVICVGSVAVICVGSVAVVCIGGWPSLPTYLVYVRTVSGSDLCGERSLRRAVICRGGGSDLYGAWRGRSQNKAPGSYYTCSQTDKPREGIH